MQYIYLFSLRLHGQFMKLLIRILPHNFPFLQFSLILEGPHQKPYLLSVFFSFSNWMWMLLALNSPWFNCASVLQCQIVLCFYRCSFFCNDILVLLLDCKLNQAGFLFLTHFCPMHLLPNRAFLYKRRGKLFRVHVFKSLRSSLTNKKWHFDR